MSQTCRTCRWYYPGRAYPHFDQRGQCLAIHDAVAGDREVAIEPPASRAVLRVNVNFGRKLHEEEKP